MRYKSFFCLLVLTSSSVLASGFDIGRGGDVVYCKDSEANELRGYYTLDFVAARTPNNSMIVPGGNWQGSRTRLLALLQERDSHLYRSFKTFLHYYDRRGDLTLSRRWEGISNITDHEGGLVDIRDEHLDENQLPENCVIQIGQTKNVIQAVIRKVNLDTCTIYYTYDKDLFLALETARPLQFSFLMVHEWLRDLTDDPATIRAVNMFLHSAQLEGTNGHDFREVLHDLGLRIGSDAGFCF
ncbi:MAG: hypothetical protein AB7T49_02855 [Oligoflexales bacterium]